MNVFQLTPYSNDNAQQYRKVIAYLKALAKGNDVPTALKTAFDAIQGSPVALRKAQAETDQRAREEEARREEENRKQQEEARKRAAELEKQKEDAARKAEEERRKQEEQKKQEEEEEENRKQQETADLKKKIKNLLADDNVLGISFQTEISRSTWKNKEELQKFLNKAKRVPPLKNTFVPSDNSPSWQAYLQGYGRIEGFNKQYLRDESDLGKKRLQAHIFVLSTVGAADPTTVEMHRKALAFLQ